MKDENENLGTCDVKLIIFSLSTSLLMKILAVQCPVVSSGGNQINCEQFWIRESISWATKLLKLAIYRPSYHPEQLVEPVSAATILSTILVQFYET